MSLVIQTKVTVVSKYVNKVKGSDGTERSYYNLTTINGGRPDVIGVNESVFNAVEEGGTYVLEGGCSGLGKNKSWWFSKVVK